MSGGEGTESDDPEESTEDWLERGVEEGDVSVDLDTPPDGDATDGEDDATESDTPTTSGAPTDVEDPETTPDAGDDESGEDAALFEQDFASALDESDGAAAGLEADPGGAPVDDGGFDEGGFDDGGFGEGGEFAGGGELGGGGFAAGAETDFEDEDIETEIDRIRLGIEGLDEMVRGGVPERSLMVAIGSAGTGKTTFGIQFLNQELVGEDGNAVYITLEESRERIIDSATEKGYDFDEYVQEGRLAIVDLDPIEMANSLATIRSELPRLIKEFGAERLVLDSVSLLEMMYDDRAKRRNEIYDFTRSLKEVGVTTMMTSEAASDSPYSSRYGIVEYLTDAVFVLQYVRPSDFRKTRLAIEIQKIRDANHSRETKPYEITNDGLSVYRQANIF
ncbi:KaiC domain-containing protein [Halobacteriales archaeon SW_5_70_135]|nr:MAG: KaiC domain-containing protein [Halobacteriales archaeon SW_5_70_135]